MLKFIKNGKKVMEMEDNGEVKITDAKFLSEKSKGLETTENVEVKVKDKE